MTPADEQAARVVSAIQLAHHHVWSAEKRDEAVRLVAAALDRARDDENEACAVIAQHPHECVIYSEGNVAPCHLPIAVAIRARRATEGRG